MVCTLAGYALTFFRIPFKEAIFILLILPILIPAISLIIPIYKLLKSLGSKRELAAIGFASNNNEIEKII